MMDEKTDFYQFAEELLESRKMDGRYYKKLSEGSLKRHGTTLGTLQRHVPGICFAGLHEESAWDVRGKLQMALNQRGKPYLASTVNQTMTYFMYIIKAAERKNLLGGTKVLTPGLLPVEGKEIVALTEIELKTLLWVYETKLLSLRQREGLRIYLTACFTGLRVSDIKRMKREHIKDDAVVMIARKNSKPLHIPLNGRSAWLIKKFSYPEGFFFPQDLLHFSDYNYHLQRIVKKHTSICKHLSMHTGRKTFATLFLNHNPGQLDLLASLLGDCPEQVYGTYASYMDQTKRATLRFFDERFGT